MLLFSWCFLRENTGCGADERAYRYRHPIPTEKRLYDYLVVNCNARKWGLITTITRSVYLGTVPDSLREQVLENQCFCWNPSIAWTKLEDAFIATPAEPVEITRPVIFPQLEISVGARTFRLIDSPKLFLCVSEDLDRVCHSRRSRSISSTA